MTPTIGSVEFFKMAAIFTEKYKNDDKMNSFEDIKFIFVAKYMFLRTTMSNKTQYIMYSF